MRRRNGCDVPHLPGRGIKTILGTEILECPNKRIPPHLLALVRAYNMGGAEAGWSVLRASSPIFVEAMLCMRATNNRLTAERMKPKPRAADGH